MLNWTAADCWIAAAGAAWSATKQPTSTSTPSAVSLAKVERFCSSAPQRTPKWLTSASTKIIPKLAAEWPKSPSHWKYRRRVSAKATASAAIVPVLITQKKHQPYRNATSRPQPSRRKAYWPPASGNMQPSSA